MMDGWILIGGISAVALLVMLFVECHSLLKENRQLRRENQALHIGVAKFDHDGDGRPGGSRKKQQGHIYWGAGERNCPPDIKAGNGELHTLRCKICNLDSPKQFECLEAVR